MNTISRACAIAVLLSGFLFAVSEKESLKFTRTGKISDTQGICALKPKLQERWTPVMKGTLLDPGDLIRTDPRGANALQGRLSSGDAFILGPGSLVEIVNEKEIRLFRGEIEIVPAEKSDLMLRLPGDQVQRIKDRKVLRVLNEQTTELKQDPDWLKYFKGVSAKESMGTLLAKIDGRNQPLTIGYHKVTVDIRDQIARTVIEESFVNHTIAQLEGVFHFPLPQDASISGFGMWIGNEYVEADVVEKQRAREIYETILRERRDPGLLEWTGGNIFKARVFPIFPHSEKRIKISYTQVLPMQGNRYRYSYSLQSEMLKQHSLRELALNVTVHSELPIRNVLCPTHEARVSRTEHSAKIEFSAQEYTPKRDFEIEIEADTTGREAILIPHKRGDDGYFLLLVSDPSAKKNLLRTLVPDGPPLDLIIVADTSASMDRSQREAQARFISSLLGALSAKDRCRLAVADVDCKWFRDGEGFAPSEQEVAEVQDFLSARNSLGWTDLAKTFSNIFARAKSGTQIVYVGDGIGTVRDANPVTIAQELKRLYQGSGAVHTVATGNSFEPGILKALAGMGSGSFRRIEGPDGPQKAAMALLGEIAQPAIRDLAVEFKGLRTARMYPEVLPNMPAGMQQIVLGRYLPDNRTQSGEVRVSGTRDGKPVGFASAVTLDSAETGNDFIPRLWARMHVDALLEQGRTEAVRNEIISLSEEYNIMTPYTSFLVLESDEDRERFKVKRHFRMRDGERFFAEGRDEANLDLRQKQMRLAGEWRQDLRRSTLRELLELGRKWTSGRLSPGFNYTAESSRITSENMKLGSEWAGNFLMRDTQVQDEPIELEQWFASSDDKDFNTLSESNEETMNQLSTASRPERYFEEIGMSGDIANDSPIVFDGRGLMGGTIGGGFGGGGFGGFGGRGSGMGFGVSTRYDVIVKHKRNRQGSFYTPLFNEAFPPLSAPPVEQPPPPGRKEWPEEAKQLSVSLLRQPMLDKMEGGLDIDLQFNNLNPRTGAVTSVSRLKTLYSPSAWVSESTGDRNRTLIDWATGAIRAVVCTTMHLGRQRKAQKEDLTLQLPGFGSYPDHSIAPLSEAYRDQAPTLKKDGKGNILLTFRYPNNDSRVERLVIDPLRHVLLSRETRINGNLVSRTTFDEFIEVAGCWWATKITMIDAENRKTASTVASIKKVDARSFEKNFEQALPDQNRALIIKEPLPQPAEARQALSEKEASFEDFIALMDYYSQTQQWDRVNDMWRDAKPLVEKKPGTVWAEDLILEKSRRHEELAQRYFERAGQLVRDQREDEFFLCSYLQNHANRIMQTNERLLLHESLRPLFERQPARFNTAVDWRKTHADLLRQAGRREEAASAWKSLSMEFPGDVDIQTRYVGTMAEAGELPAALERIKPLLNNPDQWTLPEKDSVRATIVDQMKRYSPAAELLAFLETWTASGTTNQQAYENYLETLIRMHRTEKANALISEWCEEGIREAGNEQNPGNPTEKQRIRWARLEAAARVAIGNWYYYGNGRGYDERWNPLFASVVKGTYRTATLFDLAARIMQHQQFSKTREAAELRNLFTDALLKDAATLDSRHIQSMVGWLQASDPALKDETWRSIARAITLKWEKEKIASERYNLGQTVVQVLGRLPDRSEMLNFLRRQTKDGPDEYREASLRQLFDNLLTQRWSDELETECFSLLPRLNSAADAEQRFAVIIPALYRLVDAMAESRYKALLDAVAEKEAMSRTEYQALESEKRKEAGEGLIKRLTAEAKNQETALSRWLAIERITIAAKLKQDPHALAGECLELLGPEPAPENEITVLGRHFENRCITTLSFLSARQASDETITAPALRFIDNGIKGNPDSGYWKYQKYRLLVALDRPADLEKTLDSWIRQKEADDMWRIVLGYLKAEQNHLQDAIGLFEMVKISSDLGPRELRSLADWQLAEGRKDRYQDELIDALIAEGENGLSNRLNRILQPLYRQSESMPQELDPEVFGIFKALFKKSQNPHNYIGRLNEFYRRTRDFRLLECLAEGILGHSRQQVYPFVTNLEQILTGVRDEATVDGIITYIAKIRKRDGTQTDRRALDILEFKAERRAAELINQPGPHATAALAAMKRAFKGSWAPGERRLMADMLAALGRINGDELEQEQLRQLGELLKNEDGAAEDRLRIAERLARTQWAYDRKDDALMTLETALADYRETSNSVLPVTANSSLSLFVQYLKDARHFARAERYLQNEMKHPANIQQGHWMQERLFEVYTDALRHKGTVSFGSRNDLYTGVLNLFLDELNTDDPGYRKQLIGLMCGFFRAAREGNVEPVGLREFAFETFGAFLDRETDPNNYHDAVRNMAETLHDLLGVRTGLEFLIVRMEKEPDWVQANNRTAWHYYAYHLAEWRRELGSPGNLSDRLLQLVIEELKHDLRTRNQADRSIYLTGHRNFWSEKAKDFLAAANQVWDERRPSAAAAKYISEYLHNGLHEFARAIEILDEVWQSRRLDEAGMLQLADYQQKAKRFEESIPVLGELVRIRPDTIRYRTMLMHSFFKTERAGKLRDLLMETDKRFHEKGLWQESNIAAIAYSCLENQLYKEAVAYYDEVIPLHKRTRTNQGSGDSTLSTYYAQLSQAHAALGQTIEAVEAASGAVVCWGSNDNNRRNALNSLKSVLAQAPDLDSYVEYLEKQAEETGLENPTVRQALGQVYLEKNEYKKAAEHLRIAAETQPDDRQTYELLIQAYDRANDPEGAVRQLLASVELSRRDINLYKSLGDRFKKQERQEDAERAYAGIVEMQPNESESHTMLAEIRQSQNRWEEAIEQWKHVARIRALEPTGLLRLAEAQIHEKRWEDARQTIDTILRKDWPDRFGSVYQQAQNLRARIQ